MQRSLSEWLDWQASLSPNAIELGLERVRQVAGRLETGRPGKALFTVGGTNGKGSTVRFIEELCAENGLRTAVYTSPHLVRYNERMRIDRRDVSDEWLVGQFERVDAARGEVPLTYFEFGTLAMLTGFTRSAADVWILEVGLGGRLDAVNVIDPDFSLVTTVSLEHQEWLGDTIDRIAAEKAGILRRDRPAFYGDEPVPDGFLHVADEVGARLFRYGHDFGYRDDDGQGWTWFGAETELPDLPGRTEADDAQLKNFSLGLAALEACDPDLLDRQAIEKALAAPRPPGRFQVVERDRQWIVDVAHNPQAAEVLCARLARLGEDRPLTIVIGLLADKQVDGFVSCLADIAERWLVCSLPDARGLDAAQLSAAIRRAGARSVVSAGTPVQAFERACRVSEPGSRILVTGSFRVAGPALSWLGLY